MNLYYRIVKQLRYKTQRSTFVQVINMGGELSRDDIVMRIRYYTKLSAETHNPKFREIANKYLEKLKQYDRSHRRGR